MKMMFGKFKGQPLAEISDELLLELLLREDLPGYLTNIYNVEVDRRMAGRDQHAMTVMTTTMTTLNLPFFSGAE